MVPTDDSNKISALSALLDFYGDRAVSFASLFVASIFGLVTVAAVIQVVGTSNFPSEIRWLEFLAIVISAGLYLIFGYAGYYTFSMFSNYTTIADTIISECLNKYAGNTYDSVETFETDLGEKDKEAFSDIIKELEEPKIKNILKVKEGKKQDLNLRTYLDIKHRARGRFWLRRIVLDRGWVFKLMFLLALAGLALLAYYPILNKLLF